MTIKSMHFILILHFIILVQYSLLNIIWLTSAGTAGTILPLTPSLLHCLIIKLLKLLKPGPLKSSGGLMLLSVTSSVIIPNKEQDFVSR